MSNCCRHSRRQPQFHQALCSAGVLAVLSVLPGCIDADSIIEARRSSSIQIRLEEVDLGEYRVSLPRPDDQLEVAEVQFHAFGHVAHRDMKSVRTLLEDRGPELRHNLLMQVRQLTLRQIEDPNLTELREHIVKTINGNLEGEPLQSVGFYRFRYLNL